MRHLSNSKDIPEFLGHNNGLSSLMGLEKEGGGSFLFWNFAGLWFRRFAELLEFSTNQPGKTLISPIQSSPNQTLLGVVSNVASLISDQSFGISVSVHPGHRIQHAGYYFLTAAKCMQERRVQYLYACSNQTNGNLKVNLSQQGCNG